MDNMGIPGSSDLIMQQPLPQRKPAGHYKHKKRRLKRLMAGTVSLFIILCLCFMGFLHASFQPFEMLRNLWVTSAITSMNHQYLATWLFSDSEISKIQQSNEATILGNSNPMDIYTNKGPSSDNNAGTTSSNSDPTDLNTRSRGSNTNSSIELIDISQKGFKGYLLKVNNPARVQVAATRYLGIKGEKAEDIAKEIGAVAVINGGVFSDLNGSGNGGRPLGILISEGNILYKESLTTYDIIGFDSNNVLVLGHYSEVQIKQMGIRDAVTFEPFLVVNGTPAITYGNGGWGIAPRTAIGQTRDGTILMLVIDGRQIGSLGATLKDVQDIMLEYGAYNVANLDGGASTVLYYNNQIVNHPSSLHGERLAPSFFIVK